ncbi:hypothetical protein GCM10027199_80410 [Amycolatopsis magusensis]
MSDGHLVVRFNGAIAIHLENPASSDHAERMHFGGSERTHAGRADHRAAGFQYPQDFFMTHRWVVVVQTIYDHDYVVRPRGEPDEVAVLDRGVYLGQWKDFSYFGRGQCRPGEHMRPHCPPQC